MRGVDTLAGSGFSSRLMLRRFSLLALLALAPFSTIHGGAKAPASPRQLEKADALPLALDDAFSFRKHGILSVDPTLQKLGRQEMVDFERARINYKAVTGNEYRSRYGQYFTFWWRARREANLTVRLEYRQQNLGPYVQGQEVKISKAKGTLETKFQVTGDSYNQDGRVIAWRALLIENGKIVALRQSYLWY